MKKILALILAIAMCATMLAGCGEKTPSSSDNNNTNANNPTQSSDNQESSGPVATSGVRDGIELHFDYVSEDVQVASQPWLRGDITSYTTGTTGMKKVTPADTIVFGGTANVEGAYPPTNQQENQWSFNVYESLYQRDYETGEYYPWLAEKMEYEGDTDLHIYLRKGVKFHDGNEMTAEDVMYTFRLSADSPKSRAWTAMQSIDWDASEIIDDYHLVLKTKSYLADYISLFASGYLSIMSKDFVESVGKDYAYMDASGGTGPYFLTGMVSDVSMSFERFDDYWGGVPEGTVKYIEYKRYSDENVMYIDFLNGNLDFVYRIQNFDVEQILNGTTKDVTMYRVPNNRAKAIIFNQTPGNVTDDINVRKAVAHAINYTESMIARYGGNGYAVAQLASCLLTGIQYQVDIGTYEYDLELAKEYLAKAGYDTNNRLTLKCCTTTSANNDEFAEMMLGYLAVIGIDLELDILKSSAFKEETQGGMESSPYDIVVASGAIADFGNGTPIGLSTYIVGDREPGEFNPLGAVYDYEIYELYLEAQSSKDPARTQECYTAIQQAFFDNVWKIVLWADAQTCGVHPWIQNTYFTAGQCLKWSEWRIAE